MGLNSPPPLVQPNYQTLLQITEQLQLFGLHPTSGSGRLASKPRASSIGVSNSAFLACCVEMPPKATWLVPLCTTITCATFRPLVPLGTSCWILRFPTSTAGAGQEGGEKWPIAAENNTHPSSRSTHCVRAASHLRALLGCSRRC